MQQEEAPINKLGVIRHTAITQLASYTALLLGNATTVCSVRSYAHFVHAKNRLPVRLGSGAVCARLQLLHALHFHEQELGELWSVQQQQRQLGAF
jgi:hypothetical protein